MASPAPKSPEQTTKIRKYDRQLRLWGDHGQNLLENSKICLLNATALGTEILKSLVLPGIGRFTIVDGEKVTEEDVGSNFFLDSGSVGMSRARAATQGLLELNPDVCGDYIDESPENVMAHSQDFFKNFTVVIATALTEKVLLPLSRHLWSLNVPLFVCRSVGFLGYIRLQIKEHTVIETHPDNVIPDLRLENPWDELKSHLDTINVQELNAKERSHVPALTILYYYLKQFKKNGGVTLNKPELKRLISQSAADPATGLLEENFEQALKFVSTALNAPQQIQDVLNDDSCLNLTAQSSPFWVMCAALREFVSSENSLPVTGSLPDMASDTSSYVKLQEIYQKQAVKHAETIYRRAVQISRSLGQNSDAISETDVKLLCKHASELHVLRGNCLADDHQSNIIPYLEDLDSLMSYYVILRGLERFISEYNTYPGQFDDQVEPDVLKLKTLIAKLLAEWGCSNPTISDERVHEVCTYGGAELHSVSAILGGAAAHEVVKVLTHQYKPINNTFIYDAITSTSATFVL